MSDMTRGEREHALRDKAAEAHRQLSHWSNAMTKDDEAFVEAFLNEHPTLIQREVELFLKCLYALAKDADEGRYVDDRSKASVESARKVRAALGEYGDSLPFI